MIIPDLVYKLVNNQWCSVAAGPRYRVQYQLGVVARPPVGQLFAFESVAQAEWFAGRARPYWHLLECEAQVVVRLPRLVAFDHQEIKEFWAGTLADYRCRKPPTGTVLCAWLKPLRELARPPYHLLG